MQNKNTHGSIAEAYKQIKETINWEHDVLMGKWDELPAIKNNGRLVGKFDAEDAGYPEYSAPAEYYHHGQKTYGFFDNGQELIAVSTNRLITPEEAKTDYVNSINDMLK